MANSSAMAVEARDDSNDWVLSEAARPRSFAELESRVDLALTVAQSSEAAAVEVGAAAIEAAEQARQAAELAERAARAAQAAADAPLRAESKPEPQPEAKPEAEPEPVAPRQEEWLLRFTHRAERLSERLVRLQHV